MRDILTIRNELAAMLRATLADANSPMDSGADAESVDLWVWIDGVEYALTIRKSGRTEAPK